MIFAGLARILRAAAEEADRLAEEESVETNSPLAEHAPAAPGPTLLSKAELARELGVSPRTVDRLRSDGCPVVWVVESPRFELGAVLAWLKGRK